MAWFKNFRINNALEKKESKVTSEELVWPNVFIILFLSFYLYSWVTTVVLGQSSECPKSSDFQCPIAIEHEQSESCDFSTLDLSPSNVRFCGNSRSQATLGRGIWREKIHVSSASCVVGHVHTPSYRFLFFDSCQQIIALSRSSGR